MCSNLKYSNHTICGENLPIRLFSASNKKESRGVKEENNFNVDQIIERINNPKMVIPKYEELFDK